MIEKVIIWTAMLLGLAPAILIAISTLIVSRCRQKNDCGCASLQIGTLAINLDVSSNLWPAILVLVGSAFIVLGLIFLLPKQAEFVRTKGFSKIETYVEGLLRSRSQLSSLIISTTDDKSSVLLVKEGRQTTLHVPIQRGLYPNQEGELRVLCKRLNITPTKEFVSSNREDRDAVNNFEFAVSDDPKSIAELCVQILTQVYGAKADCGLRFINHGS